MVGFILTWFCLNFDYERNVFNKTFEDLFITLLGLLDAFETNLENRRSERPLTGPLTGRYPWLTRLLSAPKCRTAFIFIGISTKLRLKVKS